MISMNNLTKIISTLGPAINNKKSLLSIVKKGTNSFRINFSHGSFDEHLKSIRMIREIEHKLNLSIPIIGDLQGPKFRIGTLKNDCQIFKMDKINFFFDDDNINQKKIDPSIINIPITNKIVFSEMIPGTKLLVDDGKLKFNVLNVSDKSFIAEALDSGIIKSKKGVNLPELTFNISPLTNKDKLDLEFILKHKLDYIALSFVQKSSDILELRSLIDIDTKIISKIEKPQALNDITNIVRLSDAVMIARGDLGVELTPQQVPTIQKKLIQTCRRVGKPVIVATQMLESMINSSSSTRAEASDVAGAVFDGADAVMLSAETSIGEFPEESVVVMDSIIGTVEDHIKKFPDDGPVKLDIETSIYHAVAQATVDLSDKIEAKLILAFTTTGNTAIRIARERPKMPIIAVTINKAVKRRLNLIWGIRTLYINDNDFEDCLSKTIIEIKKIGLSSSGDNIVVVSGMPFGLPGSTNSIRIENV